MDVLTLLLIIALLVIVMVGNASQHSRYQSLQKELERIKILLSRQTEIPPKPKVVEKNTTLTQEEAPKPMFPKQEKQVTELKTEPSPSIYRSDSTETSEKTTTEQKTQTVKPTLPPPAPKKEKTPTDFEKFIGENLISKIGIFILVLGIAFFVKFAIDNNWIGIYGRTAIGMLTGGILIAVGHFMRKNYNTFSSLLAGGGIAVFYLTIGIAFHMFHIFSKEMAFILMVIITIISVILSLLYNKKELAIFSQIGGYGAPFMVSTGEGNYIVLFCYLLILNAGLIILAYHKRWHILNLLAFLFTIVIFSGWLASTFWGSAKLPYLNALLFATAFYIVFFLVNILNNLKERKPFNAAEISMILSNNLFYYISGITILYNFEHGIYKGLFTVFTGLYNFIWVLLLYRKKQIDRTLIYLLIGLVMSFISLAIPIQLNGHSITLFWSAESVILLWLAQRSGIKILKTGHILILVLVFISLIMDWIKLYQFDTPIPLLINQAFITGMVVIAAIASSNLLAGKEQDEYFKDGLRKNTYVGILTLGLFFLTFMVPFLEIIYQMQVYFEQPAMMIIVAAIYIYAFLGITLWITRKRNQTAFYNLYFLSWIALILYPMVFHLHLTDLRLLLISGKTITTGNFLVHFSALPFIAFLLFIMISKRKEILSQKSFLSLIFPWFITSLIVFIASVELDNLMVLITGTNQDNFITLMQMSHKVGYPILWGICAFILIAIGIRFRKKTLRIQAISLFGLIISKLFLFDVWSMNQGGRIAAFIILGVLLLVVSFLYQKLRDLLFDQSNLPAKNQNL